jgi:hypothetical protein
MGLIDLLRRVKLKKKEAPPAPGGAEAPPEDQGLSRIAVLGHTGSGKTVFYAMLYDTLRDHADIQLTAADADTARELDSILRQMKGLREDRDERGEFVVVEAPRRFPPGTKDVLDFRFQATVHGRESFPFQAKEYQGELLDLNNLAQIEDYVRDFFRKADCILFLIEPSSYRSEVKREARLSAFNILLQKTVGWRVKTNIPVALVISKADTLEGFHDPRQVALIPERLRFARLGTFERLRDAVLNESVVAAEPAWRASVAEALDRLRGFIRHLLAHTREFQIFFVSSVGSVEQIINEFGADEVVPPAQLRPIGLEQPFLWYVQQAGKRSTLRRSRGAMKWMGGVAALWLLGLCAFYGPRYYAYNAYVQPGFTSPSSLEAVRGRWAQASLPKWWLSSGEEADVARLLSPGGGTLEEGWASVQPALAGLNPDDDQSAYRLWTVANSVAGCAAGDDACTRNLGLARKTVEVFGKEGAVIQALEYEPAHQALIRFGGAAADEAALRPLGRWLCGHATRSIESESSQMDKAVLVKAVQHGTQFRKSFPSCEAFFGRATKAVWIAQNRLSGLGGVAGGGGAGGGGALAEGGAGPGGAAAAGMDGDIVPAFGPYDLRLKIGEITPSQYHIHVRVGEGQEWSQELRAGGFLVNQSGIDSSTAIHIGVSTFQACQEGATVLNQVILRGAPKAGEINPRALGPGSEISIKAPDGSVVKIAVGKG